MLGPQSHISDIEVFGRLRGDPLVMVANRSGRQPLNSVIFHRALRRRKYYHLDVTPQLFAQGQEFAFLVLTWHRS
jgi:hypothetical protein